MGNFFFDHFGWFSGALWVACVIGMGAAINHDIKEQERFMVECLKDHKEYECTAMWRAGESKVMPVPIIIPMR